MAAAAGADGYAPVEVKGPAEPSGGARFVVDDAEDDGLGLAVVDNSPSPAPAEDSGFVAPGGEERRVKALGRKLLSAAGIVLLLFCGALIGATLSWVAMGGSPSSAASLVSGSVSQLRLSTTPEMTDTPLVPIIRGVDVAQVAPVDPAPEPVDPAPVNPVDPPPPPPVTSPCTASPFNRLPSPCRHVKFVAELQQPRVFPACFWDGDGQPHYGVSMRQVKQWLGLFDRFGEKLYTYVWGYGADCREAFKETLPHYLETARAANRTLIVNSPEAVEAAGAGHAWPGPTFETRSNEPIFVLWKNELPERHIFEDELNFARAQYDCSVFAPNCTPEVRTVPHLHGGHTIPHYDGHSNSWFTQKTPIKLRHVDRVRRDGAAGSYYMGRDYLYALDQEAATLWYHDHAMGTTRINVQTGLAGFVAHRDEAERRLQRAGVLPSGQFEMFLALSDRGLHPNDSFAGQLDYARVGGYVFVNGLAWPAVDVQPTRYRLRFLNSCNTRTVRLHFSVDHPDEWRADEGALFDDNLNASSEQRRALFGDFNPSRPPQIVPVHMVATDGGLLVEAAPTERWFQMPAERFEAVIDFAPYAGRNVTLANDAPLLMGAPWLCPFNCPPVFNSGGDRFMRFRVKPTLDEHLQVGQGPWTENEPSADAMAPSNRTAATPAAEPDALKPARAMRPLPSPYRPSLFNSPTSSLTSPFPAELRDRVLTGAVDRVRQIALIISAQEPRAVVASHLGVRVVESSDDLAGLSGTVGTASLDNFTLPPPSPPATAFVALDLLTVNDHRFSDGLLFSAPSTEVLEACTTERWEIINLTNFTHIIHLHLIEFELVGRANFSTFVFNRDPVIRPGTIVPPDPYERGPKDSFRVSPGEIVYVQGFFDRPGRFIFHCHLLEHEDLEMMHNLEVIPSECGCISSPLLRAEPVVPARFLPKPYRLIEQRDPREDAWYAHLRNQPQRNEDRGSYTAVGPAKEVREAAGDAEPLPMHDHMLLLPASPAAGVAVAAEGPPLSLQDLVLTPGGTHAWKVPYQPQLFPVPPAAAAPLERLVSELEVVAEDPAALRADRFIVNNDLAMRERLLQVKGGNVLNRLHGAFCAGDGGAPTFEATEQAEEANPQRRIELAIEEMRALQLDEVTPVSTARSKVATNSGPPAGTISIFDPTI